jgi:hypothetical protein
MGRSQEVSSPSSAHAAFAVSSAQIYLQWAPSGRVCVCYSLKRSIIHHRRYTTFHLATHRSKRVQTSMISSEKLTRPSPFFTPSIMASRPFPVIFNRPRRLDVLGEVIPLVDVAPVRSLRWSCCARTNMHSTRRAQ